jgi:threonine dehydratase
MAVAAERAHVIAEGAAGCAVAAALSPEMASKGHRKVVAIVSGGNIDLARFAALVTARPYAP